MGHNVSITEYLLCARYCQYRLAGRRFLAVLFHVIPPQVYDADMASSVVYTENETHNEIM